MTPFWLPSTHFTFKVSGSSACAIRLYREGESRSSVPCFHYVTTVILTWMLQRAPHCDMALVHDDDLDRILAVGDRTVSEDLV